MVRITNRSTTCPPHLYNDTWWKIFTPKDRIQRYTAMRAREAAETRNKENSASSSVNLNTVDRQATPASFVVPKEHRKNPVQKIKRLGIAGLFSDENEPYIYNMSLIVKPVHLVLFPPRSWNPKMKTFPLGNILEMNLESKIRYAPLRGNLLKWGMMKFLQCPVLTTTRANLIALKSCHLIPIAGLS